VGLSGRSASLIICGEAGVGKTVLLEDAVAGARGFLRLSARPMQSDSELSFAGLSDVLKPILPELDRLPRRQRDALAGALALAPATEGDRFAVGVATLGLLAAAADRTPVLLSIDDAHWLDAASREAIVFAARRLSAEGVIVCMAMRESPWLEDCGLSLLRLTGLPPPDASTLIRQVNPAVGERLRAQLIAETRGNPLAIIEGIPSLLDGGRRERSEFPRPLPLSTRLSTIFGAQVLRLSPTCQRALLLAATSDTGALDEIAAALELAGLTMQAIEEAEQADLVTVIGDKLIFKHPLVRAATYQLNGPVERRAAHQHFAEVIDIAQTDRIAWHAAAGVAGLDERAAAALERVGDRARSRRSPSAASKAYELAGNLSPAPGDRLRRHIAAAEAALLANESARCQHLIDSASRDVSDPLVRADIELLRGMACLLVQPLPKTHDRLLEEARRVEHHDPARAAALLAQAYYCTAMSGATSQALEEATLSWHLALPEGSPSSTVAMIAFGTSRAIMGDVVLARRSLYQASLRLSDLDPLRDGGATVWAGMGFVLLEDWTKARQLFSRVIQAARDAPAPSALPLALSCLSELEYRVGGFGKAYVAATEGYDLARATAQDVTLPFVLNALARCEAVLGYDTQCRKHAQRALESAAAVGFGMIEAYAPAVLGLLELGRGRAEAASEPLMQAARAARQHGTTQAMVPSAGDLIEAHARCGRRPEALREVEALAREVEQTHQRWGAAAVARYRGVLASDNSFEPFFEEALQMQSNEPSQFEVARTDFCLGQRRRRAGQRASARQALHKALDRFEALAAQPWADQARVELRATGEAASEASDHAIRTLTPQELQVALVVAEGATNKEAAASLFLSVKTVEFHLHNTYNKLGIRSRSELTRKITLATSV
jgi:DNA-binding CsgD family transcriptional regulator